MSEAFYKEFRTRGTQKFLYSLYKLQNTSNVDRKKRYEIINKAKKWQIDILIKTLRNIVVKVIPIPEHMKVIVKKARLMPHLTNHFLSAEGYAQLKLASLEEQKKKLSVISTYHSLLHRIFN